MELVITLSTFILIIIIAWLKKYVKYVNAAKNMSSKRIIKEEVRQQYKHKHEQQHKPEQQHKTPKQKEHNKVENNNSTQEESNDLTEDFDLRKAIIYKEILESKYDKY